MSAPSTAKCKHTQWSKFVSPETGQPHNMCTECGHTWTGLSSLPSCQWKNGSKHNPATCGHCNKQNTVPTSYQRRLLQKSKGGVVFPKTPASQGDGWITEWFGTALQPKTFEDAAQLILEWNQTCQTSGMLVEYRLDTDLKCSKCNKKTSETFAGNTCVDCHMEDKKAMMKNKHDWMKQIGMEEKPKPVTNFSNQFQSPIKKPVLLKREEGDIWEIPASSSPLWVKQWGYQGSAKEPYIISKKKTTDGGTSADGWACSCRAFTQHSPRKDCKHIINVKHTYGFAAKTPANAVKHAVANLDSEEAAAFAEFKRQKAQNAEAKPTSGDADLALFGQTGRKFR